MFNFEDEEQRGRIADLARVAGVGAAAGLAVGGAAYHSPLTNAIADPLMQQYNNFSYPKPTTFYRGERVAGEVNSAGAVQWFVDKDTASHGAAVPMGEMKKLNRAWNAYEDSPEGKKLFLAVVEDSDGLGDTRRKLYARRGFSDSPIFPGVISKDNRPFAQPLAPAYETLDRLDFARRKHPVVYNMALNPLRQGIGVGIGTLAALGGGYMANKLSENY